MKLKEVKITASEPLDRHESTGQTPLCPKMRRALQRPSTWLRVVETFSDRRGQQTTPDIDHPFLGGFLSGALIHIYPAAASNFMLDVGWDILADHSTVHQRRTSSGCLRMCFDFRRMETASKYCMYRIHTPYEPDPRRRTQFLGFRQGPCFVLPNTDSFIWVRQRLEATKIHPMWPVPWPSAGLRRCSSVRPGFQRGPP